MCGGINKYGRIAPLYEQKKNCTPFSYMNLLSRPTAKQVGLDQKTLPVTLSDKFSRAISRVPTRTYFIYEIITFRLVSKPTSFANGFGS